jgi:hypothetical protein
MVLNPRTLRCVKATGRVARELVRRGNIGELDVGYYAAAAPPAYYRRRTVRAPRIRIDSGGGSLAAAFGAGSGAARSGLPAWGALFEPAAPAQPIPLRSPPARATPRVAPVPILTGAQPCPPGTTRNPQTRRCIKLTGRTYKKLTAPAPLPAPPVPPPAPRMKTTRYATRVSSEESPTIPVGSAAPVPIGDRDTVLEWADLNCENSRDPITGSMFATASLDALQGMMRTHDGHCTFAPALNRHVYSAHRKGDIATLPADPTTHMTLDDFKALRSTMRRQDPSYKIPGRRHQPPPPSWQLYIAKDRRSGPDYASVMYVDTAKVRYSAYGVEYPPDSVRVDLGFIPTSAPAGSICSPKTVTELIMNVAKMNKLLIPVAGGWKPVAGFPFKKSYWDTDRAGRMSRLCQDLAKVMASPI